ncbi:hypothetical protein JTB14_004659 [Gonioctena quinquepunctata]|nr:hypothetical protein JTB14_004659 [Gonioctena quinquepunctata]
MSEELKMLIKQRGILEAQLTRFVTFLDDLKTDMSKFPEINSRLSKLDIVWNYFDEIQTKVKPLDSSLANLEEREIFENKYFESVSRAEEYSSVNEKPVPNEIPIESSLLNIPRNIKLADPSFRKPSKIDILIGAQEFYNFLCVGQIKLGNNQPVLQRTVFGWIISGPVMNNSRHITQCNLITNQELQNQLERFWLEEQGSSENKLSEEEIE